MQKNRDFALSRAFKLEGGFVIRATEHGGAGNHGVAFDTFCDWWRQAGKPGKPKGAPDFPELRDLTIEGAKQVYADLFMRPIAFDDLSSGVDYFLFELAVNGGPGGACRIAGKAVGIPSRAMSPKLRWALKNHDPRVTVNALCDARIAEQVSYRLNNVVATHGGKTWGQIWTERFEQDRKIALGMVEK